LFRVLLRKEGKKKKVQRKERTWEDGESDEPRAESRAEPDRNWRHRTAPNRNLATLSSRLGLVCPYPSRSALPRKYVARLFYLLAGICQSALLRDREEVTRSREIGVRSLPTVTRISNTHSRPFFNISSSASSGSGSVL